MFRSIKTLISDLIGDARPRVQDDRSNRWLATAALLTRVATIHREMSEVRREKLRATLKSSFALDDRTAAQLVEEAVAVDRNAIDLYHFTRQLNEVLDDEGRNRTVRMMWDCLRRRKCQRIRSQHHLACCGPVRGVIATTCRASAANCSRTRSLGSRWRWWATVVGASDDPLIR